MVIQIHIYIHTVVYTYIHMHVCICVCVYIYICIYTWTHTRKDIMLGGGWEGVYEREKYIYTLFSWVLLIFICFIFAGQSIYH